MNIRPTTREEAVARAVALIGTGWYKLGAGASIDDESPFGPLGNNHPGFCDCSGFTAHVTGHARKQPRGEYNTDAIVNDVYKVVNGRITRPGPRLMYDPVPKGEKPLPGDLLVYPGRFDLDDNPDRDVPGHIGIVKEVLEGFVRGGEEWWEDVMVIHCTPRKQKTLGAIKLTDATLWASRGYFIRPKHYKV